MMRASSLDRLHACPASHVLPQANTSSQWATAGTERHAWLAALVETRDPAAAPEEYYEAAEAILARLPANARAEVALEYRPRGEVVLTGHADVIAIDDERKHVTCIDWKSHARQESAEVKRQTLAYAAMAAESYDCETATIAIVYVTDGRAPYWDVAEHDSIALAAALEEVVVIKSRIDRERAKVAAGKMPDVAEGSWCRYCPSAHACPAKVQLLRRLASGDEAMELAEVGVLDDAQAALALERIEMGTALLARMKAAIYARASERPILLRNGNLLGKVFTQGNEKIDGEIAWKVLTDEQGRDCADAAITRSASKKAIGKALRKYLEPGKKIGEVEEQVYGAIRAAGGITRTWSEKITEYAPEEKPVTTQPLQLTEETAHV